MTEPSTDRAFGLTPHGVTWLGLAANLVLATAKILVGLVLHSRALLADGVHAASDLVTDVVMLAGLNAAEKPADPCHPYGHRRIATLVGMFIGTALLGAAAWILYDALAVLQRPAAAIRAGIPLILAAASVPVKEILFRLTRAVARRTRNVALRANAWHHRTDAVTSVAATAGLAGVTFGGPAWGVLDPVTAVILAAFLVVVAVRILTDAASELVDRAPDPAVLATIESAVAATDGVAGFHAVRARQIGGRVEMDIHVQVDPGLTVEQGHAIASNVERRVLESPCDVAAVVVHVEPAGGGPAG